MEHKDLSNSTTPRHNSASYSVAASYFGMMIAVLDDVVALFRAADGAGAAGVDVDPNERPPALPPNAGAGAGLVEPKGLIGAALLIGGKAVLEAGLAAGAGAGAAEKGLFGATALIGGNPEGAGFLVAAAVAAV